jgi:hypothetical protein
MAPHYSAGTKDAMIKRTETFLLRQSLQSNIIIALAMERKFQLNQPSQNQPSQTLEHSRLGQEGLWHLSHLILAAQETDAGLRRAGACRLAVSHPRPGQDPLRRNACYGLAEGGDTRRK